MAKIVERVINNKDIRLIKASEICAELKHLKVYNRKFQYWHSRGILPMSIIQEPSKNPSPVILARTDKKPTVKYYTEEMFALVLNWIKSNLDVRLWLTIDKDALLFLWEEWDKLEEAFCNEYGIAYPGSCKEYQTELYNEYMKERGRDIDAFWNGN